VAGPRAAPLPPSERVAGKIYRDDPRRSDTPRKPRKSMALESLALLVRSRSRADCGFWPQPRPLFDTLHTPGVRPARFRPGRARLRYLARIEQALDEDQVEPAAEFASYLGHSRHLLETQASVQGERSVV
jgi:hypothetical protein